MGRIHRDAHSGRQLIVPTVVVAGLGPAGPDLVTDQTRQALRSGLPTYVRTMRHPAAVLVPEDHVAFDDLYEAADSFDEVYRTIVARLVDAARSDGEVLYVVPGSPAVAEHTVELLLARDDLTVRLLPALSFADLTWTQIGVDPLAEGVRIVDGRRFAIDAAGERGPLLVAQCDRPHVLSDIKLSVEESPAEPVLVLQRLGTPDESITSVAWDDLDRTVEPDHLTSLYIPRLAEPIGAEFERFAELVRRLRSECPWDAEQTHHSLRRHLLEETYEVLEAIDALEDDDDAAYLELEEELGDVLFQVFFHALLAAEQGRFTVADVARTVHDKLRDRHPHVFDPDAAPTASDVAAAWERNKVVEKGRDSVMDGIPAALPALLYVLKAQKRASAAGFGYQTPEAVYQDVLDELAEVRADPSDAEIGDLVFAAVGVARVHGVDPEMAARGSARVFADRVRVLERLAQEAGIDLAAASDAQSRTWWELAKREVGGPADH